MQSRNLLNLLLLSAAVVLALTAWFVYQDKSATVYLSTLDPAEVETIFIPREHGDIVLTKAGSNWQMQKPFALPAHPFRVQSLLDLLRTQVTHSYSGSDQDLKQFGLNPPYATIRFNNQEIHFGKSNPVTYKRYVLSDNRIYLLEDRLYPLVSAEAASLVSLSLLDPAMIIKKINLPDLSLQQDDKNIWHDQQGNTITADRAQQLVDNWRKVSAFAVHAYMARANAKPAVIESTDNKRLQFEVSQENDWLILGHPEAGVEYHLDVQHRDKLLQLQAE